ncbi:MAG: hypothetical protein EOO09_02390 [Chitinophagaceae bacterium]|nr:MAG: hypothetical protein EOO09_02390 [Chitinophagaceae bacterium]
MSTRYVNPGLFNVSTQLVRVGDRQRPGLRWILHPSLGLPLSLFQVWQYGGQAQLKGNVIAGTVIQNSKRLYEWFSGDAAVVELTVDIIAGNITATAFSGPSGGGQVVDQVTLGGPVNAAVIRMKGCVIASVVIDGSANVTGFRMISANDFVNDPGWRLVEEVGLPVDNQFAVTGYPTGPQGPVGAPADPLSAAMIRVRNGTPDLGWDTVTDRGTAVPAFVKPDPELLVKKEINQLMEALLQLLEEQPDPARQAETEISIRTDAPSSIHGRTASAEWQLQAQDAKLRPLDMLLMTAGVDSYASLALGFGTTLGENIIEHARAANPAPSGAFMVTVKHEILMDLTWASGFLPIKFPFNGEFCAFCFQHKPYPLDAPAGLFTSQPQAVKTETPAEQDGPWLSTINLNWLRPATGVAWLARPTGFAITRQLPATTPEFRMPDRLSGGWMPLTPVIPGPEDENASVRFADTAVPEPLPGEAPGQVYSVAAHDWFGRWGNWISADHTRQRVAPQIPALLLARLEVAPGAGPARTAEAVAEFTWDWAFRSPANVSIRVLVHEDGSAVPAVSGSVLAVGAPAVADTIIDFNGTGIDTAPAGVDLVAEESNDTIRKYKIRIGGLAVNYANQERTKLSIRIRGTERFDPAVPSAWSRDVTDVNISPIPPPAPFVPSAMTWSAIPDPKGISRIRLTWPSTAPKYAVYLADESALTRELGLPSPELRSPAAARLPALRAADITNARNAFRKVADGLRTPAFEFEFPRGSALIHFFAITPISNSGVEGPLPVSANDYFAVSVPRIVIPETPAITGRSVNGRNRLRITVMETRWPAGRVEIFRTTRDVNTITIGRMGAPWIIADETTAVRGADSVSWELEDTAVYPAWQAVYYRVVAYGRADVAQGEFAGRSAASDVLEMVVPSVNAPVLEDLLADAQPGETAFLLLRFRTDAVAARTVAGTHSVTLKMYDETNQPVTRRVSGDGLRFVKAAAIPGSAGMEEEIFRFDPVNPEQGLIYAWIKNNTRMLVIEIRDPSGRLTSKTLKL